MKIAKKLQKLGNILFIIGMCLMIATGCEKTEIVGSEKIEKARKDLAELHSGVIEVINDDTNEVEQKLVFKYDEVGILLYSLTGVSDGEVYEQYCNGYQTYTYEKGEVKKVSKGEYEYEAYTYDYRYPMTDEDFIFFNPKLVLSETVVKNGKGYTYHYQSDKIKGDDQLGVLDSFTMSFEFDENDRLLYFKEMSTYKKDNVKTEYNYRIEIKDRDSVGKIDMPENIRKYVQNSEK